MGAPLVGEAERAVPIVDHVAGFDIREDRTMYRGCLLCLECTKDRDNLCALAALQGPNFTGKMLVIGCVGQERGAFESIIPIVAIHPKFLSSNKWGGALSGGGFRATPARVLTGLLVLHPGVGGSVRRGGATREDLLDYEAETGLE